MTLTAPRRATPYGVIWRTRLFRSAVLTLFLSGIAVSSSSPQLTLFFVQELGASLPVAGLYYLTNITAPLVGFLMGRWSDRRTDRLTLFRLGALLGGLGWTAMALSTAVWMPFAVSVLALGAAGAAGSQVYAAVRDELSRHPTGFDAQVIATIRMAFTAGWIVGPVLGSVLGGLLGLRVLLGLTALLTLSQLLPMIGVRAPRFVPTTATGGTRSETAPRDRRAMGPLLAFAALAVLAVSGDTVKFAYLPLYMEQQLHTSDTLRGAVIATQPVLELVLIPVFARLATRFGAMRMVVVGTTFGVVANGCYALSSSVQGLFVGQVLMAGLWAVIAGLGVSVAQDLYPQGVGVASSTFLSSIIFASTFGGLIGSLGVQALGMPGVFFVPAGLCVVSSVGMVLLARRLRPPADPGRAAQAADLSRSAA